MPQVSVIIPVYNGEQFIEEALESVFAQTLQDFEVILINDGSTDGTEQRLEKYRGRIRYHRQENRGQSASRREGLRLANGSLIAFLDADDLWLPGKLEKQVKFALAHPECGIISTDVLSFDTEGRVVCSSLKKMYKISNGLVVEKLLFENWIPPSAALVRLECFDKVIFYSSEPPDYGEDWMMWMQIAAHYRVYFMDEVLVRRRLHSANVSGQGEEMQFDRLLHNLEILRQRIPQLKGRPDLTNEAAFRICFRRGVNDLRAAELPRARQRLRRAVSYKPHSITAWAALGAAHIPRVALRGLKKVMGKGSRPPVTSRL